MSPEHSRKILKMEAKRLRKQIFRGSSFAEDEACFKFNEIAGRDASTVSRESSVQRRCSLARESFCKLIKKEKASSVERIWYRKLSCGEDVESVREVAKAYFYKTKLANLDLEVSVIHLQEARKGRLEQICEPLDILIKFNDIVPVDGVETQPDFCNLLRSRLNNTFNTIYNRPSDQVVIVLLCLRMRLRRTRLAIAAGSDSTAIL